MKKSMLLVAASTIFYASIAIATGLETIEDVRVDALISSCWGQQSSTGYSNTGVPCFNLKTPNNYPCGCTATALAQLFRYWEYPASIPSASSKCSVGDTVQTFNYGGGTYNYGLMPLVTADAGEAELNAIGSLTYDCAVAMHSQFESGRAFAFGTFSFVQIKDVFGYENAIGYVSGSGCKPTDEMKKAIIANLDAKCPVMLTIRASANGYAHQALVDGYGYDGGKLYFHFNLGWCNVNNDNIWYELDKVSDSNEYLYDIIDAVIYNVFPKDSGDVLSGRVLSADGLPAAGVTVKAQSGSKDVAETKTDANGIYAFVLPGDKTYKIVCEGESVSVNLPASDSAKKMAVKKNKVVEADIWENPFAPLFSQEGSFGGSCGNDIVISNAVIDPEPEPVVDPEPQPAEPEPVVDPEPQPAEPEPVVDPEPQPEPVVEDMGPFVPAKAITGAYPYCGVVRDVAGNPCGTITVKCTKPTKKGVSKVSAKLTLVDGVSYSLAASPVDVNAVASAKLSGKAIKKLGSLDSLEIGERGFVAEFTKNDGTKLVAQTSDLSAGIAAGDYTFNLAGTIPYELNGLPVIAEMLPGGTVAALNSRGKFTLAKAAKIKYAKIKGSKPAAFELVIDDAKGKTNYSSLKLTYTAKTSLLKGSFIVYTNDEAKHKINKFTFNITGMVIDGKAVGMATCKKLGLSMPIVIE